LSQPLLPPPPPTPPFPPPPPPPLPPPPLSVPVGLTIMVCVRNVQEWGRCNYCMHELGKSFKIFFIQIYCDVCYGVLRTQHQCVVFLLQYSM
jgi:hypothetical protein